MTRRRLARRDLCGLCEDLWLALAMALAFPARGAGGARLRRLPGGRVLVETQLDESGQIEARRSYWPNGKLRIESVRERGLLHGPLRAWYPDGKLAEDAQYAHGELHGRCSSFYRNGRKRFIGEFVHGEKTGEWFHFHRDGKLDSRRTGSYQKGLRFAALKGFNDWNP